MSKGIEIRRHEGLVVLSKDNKKCTVVFSEVGKCHFQKGNTIIGHLRYGDVVTWVIIKEEEPGDGKIRVFKIKHILKITHKAKYLTKFDVMEIDG